MTGNNLAQTWTPPSACSQAAFTPNAPYRATPGVLIGGPGHG